MFVADVALLPLNGVASGKVIVPDAIVDVALLRLTSSSHPETAFVLTVALDDAMTAIPGTSAGKFNVEVERVREISSFTVIFIAWAVEVEVDA